MAQTFRTFGQIVAAATPERLKELIPLVMEVVEWHEDPESPGSGHYRIAYFEQPHLDLYRETPTEHRGEYCSVGGNDWLPGRYPNRTISSRVAWEITPYYSRTCSTGILLVRGQKPEELAHLARVTTRQWRRYVKRQDWENPIAKGLRFLQVFEQPAVTTYAEAASILGASRQRVYQLTSLVRKLPDEVTRFLLGTEDPTIQGYFTERRLRPLATLHSDEEKVAEFAAMLAQANAAKHPPRAVGL